MTEIVLAILPVFLLIGLGNLLRRNGFPGDSFWDAAERLTYFVLFPCLLVAVLADADLGSGNVWRMAGAIAGAILVMTLLLALLRPLLGVDGPGYTSVVQGAIRMNTYIGLAGAFALYGQSGLASAAVAVATIVPLVNLICVLSLARHGEGTRSDPAGILIALAKNPLIIGCVVGFALNGLGVGLPIIVGPTLDILARAALPLGLLAAGAGLRVKALKNSPRAALMASALKLGLLPALTALGCHLLGVTGEEASVAVLFTGLPTAVGAYILARQAGGDGPLMAGIIAVETALAMITLPLVLTFLV